MQQDKHSPSPGVGELNNSSDLFFPKYTEAACIFYDVTTRGEFDIIALTGNVYMQH